jgi:hypothetical protein
MTNEMTVDRILDVRLFHLCQNNGGKLIERCHFHHRVLVRPMAISILTRILN